ncbi:HNH endonuclease [Streptomyces venezuelae]|uniref:HNH endonuclease n=1 Tax=Streptomyces venezuelae TaxID=54571 RepID=A0A5P2DIE1_STRVZ|nr:HNH endonuclease signature motif containing protein [Streptomyces venezuelae]QES54862.1 HNH endonuclease [Streptomyces venezuelae]
MPISPYTKERLAEAARTSRTLSEALEKLGVDPKSGSREYLRRRMNQLGVDVSHFERDGNRWTRTVLEEAVSTSSNMYAVLRYLGLDAVGGHHTHISRRVRSLGIDTSHFTGPSRTERMRVNHRKRTADEILREDHSPHPTRTPGKALRRALLDLGVEERCADCGIEAVWMGEPLLLEVDHINGDWRDNRAENLRLMCPNCHSTTDSYRGRGKRRR